MNAAVPAETDHAPKQGSHEDAVTAFTRSWLCLELAGAVVSGPLAPRLRLRKAGDGYGTACFPVRTDLADAGVCVQFQLPSGGADFARLELTAVPGDYVIDGMWIDESPIDDATVRAIAASEYFDARSGSIRFGDSGEAPAVEVDLRGLDLSGSGETLRITLRRDGAGSGNGGVQRALASLRGMLETIDHAVVASASASHRKLDALAVSEIERQHSVWKRWEQLEASLARLEAAANESRDAALKHQDRLHTSLASLEAAFAVHQQRSLAVHEEIRAVRHGIENVFWRRWLRALRGRG